MKDLPEPRLQPPFVCEDLSCPIHHPKTAEAIPDPVEGLTLNEYQAIAVSTAADLSMSPITLATLGLGMAGEGGEVADRIKKVVGHGHPLTDDEKLLIIKEIGDSLWYAATLSHVLGYKLSEVARINWVKLAARYPEGFTIERSLNRVNE